MTQLLVEQPESSEQEPLLDHLETCERCRQTLAELSVDTDHWRNWEPMLQTALLTWPADEPPSADIPARAELPSIPGYEIQDVIGAGGMGVVFKARHRALNRVVALKMMRHTWQQREEFREQFRREAESLAQLNHPNLVKIYDLVNHDGCPVLVLEFVDGYSLAELLRESTLPPREAAALVETLARAMETAHLAGIIHRDLKPGNVLLATGDRYADRPQNTPPTVRDAQADTVYSTGSKPTIETTGIAERVDSSVKITDFGLARFIEASHQSGTSATMGTPSYMPPEQAQGTRGWTTPAVDVYSLGAVLYESLTGRPPFRAESSYATLMQVVHHDPVPPTRLVPGLPRDLETVVQKCLRKEPHQRYASCAELAEDLNRFCRGRPISARPTPWTTRIGKWALRHPVVASSVVTTIMAVVALLFVWARFTHDLRFLNQRLDAEKTLATIRRDSAEDARNKAREDLFHMGRSLRYFGDMLRDERELHSPNLLPLRNRLIERSMQAYSDLLQRFDGDRQLLAETADGYYWLAVLNGDLGNIEQALEYLETAIRLREKAHDITDDPLMSRLTLVTYYLDLGRQLGGMKRLGLAEDAYRKAIQLATEQLPSTKGDVRDHCYFLLANAQYNLAFILGEMAQRVDDSMALALDARESVEACLPGGEASEHACRLACRIEKLLGVMLERRNDDEPAEAAFQQAIRYAEQALDLDPTVARNQELLALHICYLASHYQNRKMFESSLAQFDRAVQIRRQLVTNFPHLSAKQRYELGLIQQTVGRILLDQQRDEDGRARFLLALKHWTELLRTGSQDPQHFRSLAHLLLEINDWDRSTWNDEFADQLAGSIEILAQSAPSRDDELQHLASRVDQAFSDEP